MGSESIAHMRPSASYGLLTQSPFIVVNGLSFSKIRINPSFGSLKTGNDTMQRRVT